MRKYCRIRKTLQTEYLVVKIGVDTAENGPSNVWRLFLGGGGVIWSRRGQGRDRGKARRRPLRSRAGAALAAAVRISWSVSSNFRRLVLGCIDSYDSEQRRILQHFSRSTRFKNLCTAPNAKFCKILTIIFWKFARFWQNSHLIFRRKMFNFHYCKCLILDLIFIYVPHPLFC